MKKILLSILFLSVLIFPSYVHADGPYLNLPPTNAFDKIHSDNGTISAVNFSMPLTVKGGSGIQVKSNNNTHTLQISSTVSQASGTYNTTQANNVNINTGGSKINFINGTGATVNVLNSPSKNQVNVTVSATGVSSGVSSLNALTGALTIACVSGNTTCTTSGGNTITVNTAYNVVMTNGATQIISKNVTSTGGITMSNADFYLKNNNLKTTNFQINDTIIQSANGILVSPTIVNNNMRLAISPSGTSHVAKFQIFRLSNVTNSAIEWLTMGTDEISTGEFDLRVRSSGTGAVLRPLNIYEQGVKELSFDITSSVTSYVKQIWTPISDPVTAFTNAIWKSSTTTDVLKYRNNANTTTYSIVSTLSTINATTGQLSGNGTGTSSDSLVMDGVYATITPTNTGRITVSVSGVMKNNISGDGCIIEIRQSTSNMGTNGAVLAGTILGNWQKTNSTGTGQEIPYSKTYDFSGPVGTKQFFDIAFARITGGTCTIINNNWDLVEH